MMRSRLGRRSNLWSSHFLATLSALLLSLLEGKTDCPISGVFGAGKTRAAAAIIAGLITVDPSLKIMILTKENVASQAFAEHIIALSLPTWIENKIGRLVGFMALHNQTTGTTKLDIPSAHRHEVIGSKQVIIGCGGGFRHECASKYSPVAQWMSEVDLTLHDESQQYGNLDETAALARLPRNCLVMWLGDHRQTPGGLRKSSCSAVPPKTLATALSSKRQLCQGSTEHPLWDSSKISYGHPQLSCISCGPTNGS